MKLFSILAISASALDFKDAFNDVTNDTFKDRTIATTFDEALGHFETRFRDMELRQFDNSEKLLVKTTRKMYRMLKRWSRQPNKQRLGCFVSGQTVPFDLALDPWKKCAVMPTLLHDVYIAALFFSKNDHTFANLGKCRKFSERLERDYYLKILLYLNGKEMPTCEHLL